MNDRFDTLWTDFLEGELDDTGPAELAEITRAHPELIATATDRYQFHKMLGYLHGEEKSAESFIRDTVRKLPASGETFAARTLEKLAPPTPRSRRNWWAPSFAAAALMLFAFTLFQKAPPQAVPPASVARLILAEDCEWQPDFAHLVEGRSLTAGPLALNSGSAVLRFTGGAELVLSGATRIELLSGNAGRLDQGDVVVRAEDGAEGFVLDTPPANSSISAPSSRSASGLPARRRCRSSRARWPPTRRDHRRPRHRFRKPRDQGLPEMDADPDAPRFAEMLQAVRTPASVAI